MAKRRVETVYCDDWACPSKWTCRYAYCRSWSYWRFDPDADIQERIRLERFGRNPKFDACDRWEKDQPRAWLAGIWTPAIPMEPPPRGFTLYVVSEGQA